MLRHLSLPLMGLPLISEQDRTPTTLIAKTSLPPRVVMSSPSSAGSLGDRPQKRKRSPAPASARKSRPHPPPQEPLARCGAHILPRAFHDLLRVPVNRRLVLPLHHHPQLRLRPA